MNKTTKLEAVNAVLAVIGEQPVNSLTGSITPDVTEAVRTLDETTRHIQLRGWWFNTELGCTFPPDDDSKIPFPPNAAAVEFYHGSTGQADPIERGNFFYDRTAQSFTFTQPLKADRVVWLLDFDDLPETARIYIKVSAARLFATRLTASPQIVGYSQQDEAMARTEFLRDHTRQSRLNMKDGDLPSRIVARSVV